MHRRAAHLFVSIVFLAAQSITAPERVDAVPVTPIWYVADSDATGTLGAGGSCLAPGFATRDPVAAYASDDQAIQAAVDLAASGETIYLCAGLYELDQHISITTTDLHFIGAGSELTILDGGDTRDPDPAIHSDGNQILYAAGGSLDLSVSGVTMRNGAAPEFDDGGAINATGEITITDSVFMQNYSARRGGAIASENGPVDVEGSAFVDNVATDVGGAISVWDDGAGSITASESTFIGNSAARGGAIKAAIVDVTGGTFLENSATTSNGGAIVGGLTVTVDASTFTGNIASIDGGAIWFGSSTSNSTVDGSGFTNNSAGQDGGAISGGFATSSSTTYVGNSAGQDGGAIRASSNIDSSMDDFVGNSAVRNGGGLYVYYGDTTVSGATFITNEAVDGGAIYSAYAGARVEVTASVFHSNAGTNKDVRGNGGDVCGVNPASLGAQACPADENVATEGNVFYVAQSGGPAAVPGDGTGCLVPDFVGGDQNPIQDAIDFAASGDAIYICEGEYLIEETLNLKLKDLQLVGAGADSVTFDGDLSVQLLTSDDLGGGSLGDVDVCGISFKDSLGSAVVGNNVDAKAASFTGNTTDSADAGGAIDASTATVTSSTFIANTSTSPIVGIGGAIHAGTVTVTSSSFTANTASYSGGAISATTATVTSSTFTANTAGYGGGAIDATTATVTSSSFTANTATDYGGAISAYTATVTSSTFTANTAGYGGGAISAYTATVTSSSFTTNTAGYGGGAIWANATVTSSTFTANTAGYGGGAISGGTATVTSSTFTANTATDSGGAISATTATVTSSSFTANTAGYGGGAISAYTATVTSSTFTANTAGYGGGAISAYTATVTSSTFIANTSTSPIVGIGGAIHAGTVTVTSSSFTANTATDSGGAISAYTATVTSSSFTTNTAGYGGGAISGGTATVTSSTFTANTAGYGGGAISGGTATVTSSTFTANTATDSGGAIAATTATVTSSTFTANSAPAGAAVSAINGSVCAVDSFLLSGGVAACGKDTEHTVYVADVSDSGAYVGGSCDSPDYTTNLVNDSTALQAAIDEVIADDDAGNQLSTVYICPGTYDLASELTTDGPLILQGESASTTILDGNDLVRILTGSDSDAAITTINLAFHSGHSLDSAGGAINALNASVTAISSEFTDNSASTIGGAIIASSITLISTDVVGSEAGFTGGAIYANNDATIVSSNLESNSTIEDGAGGAVFAVHNVAAVSSTFNTNDSWNGGAIYASDPEDATVSAVSSTFTGNTAANNGGAIWSVNMGISVSSTFERNAATSDGGAMYSEFELVLTSSSFEDNGTAPEYDVTIAVVGSGTVADQGDSMVLDCPGDCSESYAAGTAIVAIPSTVVWSGDAGTCNADVCTFVRATEATTLTVTSSTFDGTEYAITAEFTGGGGGGGDDGGGGGGGGSSSYNLFVTTPRFGTITTTNGFSCAPTDLRCSLVAVQGSRVLFNSSVLPGYTFVRWNGCTSVSVGTCSVLLNADTTISATYGANWLTRFVGTGATLRASAAATVSAAVTALSSAGTGDVITITGYGKSAGAKARARARALRRALRAAGVTAPITITTAASSATPAKRAKAVISVVWGVTP